jgi:competence protein ComGC
MSEKKKKSSGATIIKWVALCLFIGLLVAIAIPNFIRPRVTYGENACVNNLRQIDAAINEWALENKKTNGTPVTENDITPYIKLNSAGKIWGCPAGGKYIYGKVGDNPQIRCSLSTATPAHILP